MTAYCKCSLNDYSLFSISFVFLFLLSLLSLSIPVSAADFNIKIRKTDINELRQQIIPVFEQNIEFIKNLENCLEIKNTLDICLKNYTESLTLTANNDTTNEEKKLRNDQIRNNINKKITELSDQNKGIKEKELINKLKVVLKKFLIEAENVKQCLNNGQTANDLKDCIMKYKKSGKR